jgi:transcriptional regulator of arginine metabolism
MGAKEKRQEAIVEIITKNSVETQEELAAYLEKAGFAVTQATVSRDIRELHLVKSDAGGKRQKYVIMTGNEKGTGLHSARYVRVLKEGYVSMEPAQNILVINTVSGMAMAVAAALDELKLEGVVGCIAGDDTIMCVIKTTAQTPHVMSSINKILAE